MVYYRVFCKEPTLFAPSSYHFEEITTASNQGRLVIIFYREFWAAYIQGLYLEMASIQGLCIGAATIQETTVGEIPSQMSKRERFHGLTCVGTTAKIRYNFLQIFPLKNQSPQIFALGSSASMIPALGHGIIIVMGVDGMHLRIKQST